MKRIIESLTSMEKIIKVEKAGKIYETENGSVNAVENFSMEVEEGDFVAIVGPSGCGKTTLLWGLTGLHHFTSGKAYILNKEVTTPKREVGIIFQQANLLPWRRLKDNIYFPLEIMKENRSKFKAYVDELLDSVGLAGFENSFPRELSGGMQQRAAIVRALSYDPKVLLMDEPFGALDAYTRDEMDGILLNIWNKTKKTIVFVTHRIEEAVFLANRVYVMSARPGTNLAEFKIDLPRPRAIEIMMERQFFDIVAEVKKTIVEDVEKRKASGKYKSQEYSTIT